MTRYAVILAGGTGSRAGGDVPKQFHDIAGRPLLWWSLRAFREADPGMRLVLVLHPDWSGYWRQLTDAMPEGERIEVAATVGGGRDRVESVANALRAISAIAAGEGDAEGVLVAVHDGARCCVTPDLILRGFDTAADDGAAVPAVPVTDSLRRLGAAGSSSAVDRSRYVAVQTPQVFRLPLLLKAFECRESGVAYTDDASVVEPIHPITLYKGNPENIKVTDPGDFARAALIIAHRL